MSKTYEPIATTSLTNVTLVTFSSIPSTYTDLRMVLNMNAPGVSALMFRINSNTFIGNYSQTVLRYTSNVNSYKVFNQDKISLGPSNGNSSCIIDFLSYSNTNMNKTIMVQHSQINNEVNRTVGLWRNTAAINSIFIYDFSGNSFSSINATLYGIKAE